MGFVFQKFDIQLFSSTVFEEIAFGPLQLDIPPEAVKAGVEDIMEMMQISKLRDRTPHTLSEGDKMKKKMKKMKKKVCIATVLVNNPDVLLLDEPSAGLDPRTRLWLVELLHELSLAGKTVVIATHDLEIMEMISKRSIVMGEDHRIKLDDTPKNVISNYELLMSPNLVHEHMHIHGKLVYEHLHDHEKGLKGS